MKKIKIMSVFGTRPEAIKMAPIVKALETSPHVESLVCVTAQHRHMLDQVLDIFDIKPDYDLNIMLQGQTLSDITTRALMGIEEVLLKTAPDLVLVHGDTSTSFAGALAAYYAQIKIGHVEAGLRTYDKYQPFPEEINRKLTGAIADLHFAPTLLSKKNLLKENVSEDSIFVTGNTAVDVVKNSVSSEYKFSVDTLNDIDFKNKRVIAMTAHRRENLGKPFEDIFSAINKIVNDFPDVELVYAVHLNPAVREPANRILGANPRIHLIEPLDMLDMHNLMGRSYLVLTDSGGIQEEASGVKKPIIVLRNVTERPEGLEAGILKLAGTEFESVYNEVAELLGNSESYNKISMAKNPFGDGEAAKRIVECILYSFGILDSRPLDFTV